MDKLLLRVPGLISESIVATIQAAKDDANLPELIKQVVQQVLKTAIGDTDLSLDEVTVAKLIGEVIKTSVSTVADLAVADDPDGRRNFHEIIQSVIGAALSVLTDEASQAQLTTVVKCLSKAATEQVIETASKEVWEKVLANTVTAERQAQLKTGVILTAVQSKGDAGQQQKVREIQGRAGNSIFSDTATEQKQKAVKQLNLTLARTLLARMSEGDKATEQTKTARAAIQKTELKKFWASLKPEEKQSWSAPELVKHCMKTDGCHDVVKRSFTAAFGEREITCRDGKTKIKLSTLTAEYIKATLWDVLTDADKIKLRFQLMSHYLSDSNIDALSNDVISAMEMSIPMALTERYETLRLANEAVKAILVDAKKLDTSEKIELFESCLSGPQREAYAEHMQEAIGNLYDQLAEQSPLKKTIDNRLTSLRNGAVFSELAGFLASGIIQGAATRFSEIAKKGIQGSNPSGIMKFVQNLLLGDGETKVPFWIDLVAYWIKLGGAEIGKNIADHGTGHMTHGAAGIMDGGRNMLSALSSAFGW